MSIKVALLALLIAISISLPYDDQLTLASSLIVGRDGYEELIAWNCKVCDSSNKPLHAHIIEEKEKDIKCIITVYKDLIILAFRYTNTALNVWQDILYPLQVNKILFRSIKMEPATSAKSRKLTTTCGTTLRQKSLVT